MMNIKTIIYQFELSAKIYNYVRKLSYSKVMLQGEKKCVG
jgi:hypothetical protein